jgi:hypothetical protein
VHGQNPEIETPHPCQLAGEKGKRGGVTKHLDELRLTRLYRAIRFESQSHAKAILIREAMRMQAKSESEKTYLGDIFRTIDCMQRRHSYFVKVNHHSAYARASYAGLVTCGSVWACPVCAAKIQERRRCEIEKAMTWNVANGGAAMMVTFTFPHVRFDNLRDLLKKQAEAFKLLRKGRAYDDLMKSLGFVGLVRSLEVTHGQNGWHPHTHELWLIRNEVGQAKLLGQLVRLWKSACYRAGLIPLETYEGLGPFDLHSVDIRMDVQTGDYLAKQDDSRSWGLAAEVAKASSKAGKAKGVHPHHFLVRHDAGDDLRYLEYVKAMKGKRQLFWSHGLKGKAGVLEVSDEELAEREEAGATLLAAIPAPAWKHVTGNDARSELLDAVELAGWDGMCNLLRSLGVPSHHMPLTPVEYAERAEHA